MPISVTCPQCAQRYSVSDALAGRKARCKNCGGMISIPQGGTRAPVDDNSDTVAAPALGEQALSFDDPQPAQPGGRPFVPASAMDVDLRGPEEAPPPLFQGSFRTARQFGFPYARELDTILPWLVAIGAGIWVVTQALDFASGPKQWLTSLVIFTLALIFFGVFWPIGHYALRLAARQMRYEIPRPAWWRALAAYSLPAALVYVLWTTSEANGGLFSGIIAGLLVVSMLAWLFVRPAKRELPTTLSYACIAFLISVLIGYLVLHGMNLLVVSIVEQAGTSAEIKRSPFAPGFAWAPAQAVREPTEEPRGGPLIPWRPSTAPVAPPGDTVASNGPDAPAPAEPDAPEPQEPQEPGDSIFADAGDPTPATRPATPPQPDEEPTATAIDPAEPDDDPEPTAGTEPPQEDPDAFVRQIQPVRGVAGFDEVVYPAWGREWMAVVRRLSPTEDRVERWHIPTMTKKAEVRFNHEADRVERYLISPSGEFLVRVVNWPKLAAQVWSWEQRRVLRNIELSDRLGTPSLIDFFDDDLFLVRWERQATIGLETWNARTGQRLRQIPVPSHQNLPSNAAISRDGKTLAIALRLDGDATVQLYNLQSGRAARRLPMTALDRRWPVRPTGMSFSPDGSMLAILFEETGNALVMVWRVSDGKLLAEQVYPSGLVPETSGFAHPAFQWLADGSGFLLYGRLILDAETLGTLAELPLNAVGQQVIDDSTLHVQTMTGSGRQLSIVRLNPERLKPAE
jgi:hypothetical protein